MRRFAVLYLILAIAATATTPVFAEWDYDGNPVVAIADAAYVSSITSDGAGGAIIVWQDNRGGANSDIYAQRINAAGNPVWAINGVAVCTAANAQETPRLAGDGAGGAIIVWDDYRADQAIYAQRINASGVPQWTADGVVISALPGIQFLQEIAGDGAGGAIMTWTDRRNGANYDIYAQRVNAAGAPQWTANGIGVAVATGNQLFSQIIADGGGGVFLAWDDSRSGTTRIYAQHLNGSGAAQWAANGISVSGTLGSQTDATVALDGAGGVLIAWQDTRLGTQDIFINRVNNAGTTVWGFDGTGNSVCEAADGQEYPAVVSDGAGGAIVTWDDYRDSAQFDIYAQRVNAAGAPMWTYNGVTICNAQGHQQNPRVVSDGNGGAVIVWNDNRTGSSDVYARAVSATGTTVWQYDGMPVSTASNSQNEPYIVDDGAGGVIAAFNDNRSGSPHVYAQRLEKRYGYWGHPEPTATSAVDNPGDQGGVVILRWDASRRDRFDNPAITHYSVWRSTDNAAAAVAGAPDNATLHVTTPAEIGPDFNGHAIWQENTATGPAYWEWVANQSALYQDSYSILAPTRQDEAFGAPAPNYFKVVAHETEYAPSRTWESGVVSGSSIDNLSPSAPTQLTGDRGGNSVFLSWTGGNTATDFLTYRVYRSDSGDVTPSPGFLLITSDTPSYVDISAPAGALHYLVTAVDVHGNESAPSNVIGVFDATGVGDDTPALRAFTVLPNHPNPFNATTELRVGLPTTADVSVEVYDVAGRRVRVLREPGATAGWHDLRFDGRDDTARLLPGGVYFYRVTAAGKTATGKMVITR